MNYWQNFYVSKKNLNKHNFSDFPILHESSMTFFTQFIKKQRIKSVLEIGSWDNSLKEKIGDSVKYYSMDIERLHKHDFYSIHEIPDNLKVDMVCGFALLEHLTQKEVFYYFDAFRKMTKFIFFTTNNPANPASWSNDIDHKTQLSCRTLYSLAETFGFNPQVFRVSPSRHHRIRSLVSRLTDIDFCHELMVIGRKV